MKKFEEIDKLFKDLPLIRTPDNFENGVFKKIRIKKQELQKSIKYNFKLSLVNVILLIVTIGIWLSIILIPRKSSEFSTNRKNELINEFKSIPAIEIVPVSQISQDTDYLVEAVNYDEKKWY
ncbi:MAG: hypothetical protein AB1410_01385 [Acidobacteriota bacterium]